MKCFVICMLVLIVVQPLAMYLFLRVLEFDFFVSAALASSCAMVVALAYYCLAARSPRK